MGGSSTRKPLGDFGDKLKNSVVGQVVDYGSRVATGGAYSTSGKGYMQNGGPFKGDSFVRGVGGGYTAGYSDKYYEAKDAGIAQAAEAKRLAKTEAEKALGAAREREMNEKAQAAAAEDLGKKKARQDARSRGKGRQSTIVTGTADGEAKLGTVSTSKSVLGL